MMMKLKTTTVIDGIEVSKAGEINGLDVYTDENLENMYFVLNPTGLVVGKITIECGMNQGIGFVEELKFTKV